MSVSDRARLIQDVLGSAHIFSSAVNDVMQERLHRVSDEPLSFPQVKLLKLVSLADSYNITDVAAFLGVSNAAASKAVDRLVRRGFLRRGEAEGDRRAVVLSLSEAGRRILDLYETLTTEVLGEIFGRFSAEGLRETAEVLDRLSVSLLKHESVPPAVCFRCGIYFRDKCLLRGVDAHSCHFQLHRRGTRNDAPEGTFSEAGD